MKKASLLAALMAATMAMSAQTCDTVYPWHETFSNDLSCWYLPAGSDWTAYWPNTQGVYYPDQYRCIASYCNSDTMDSWIVSPAIAVPANVADSVRLFWRLWSSNMYFNHTYRVMVSTDSDRTDLTTYTTLYADTAQFSSSANHTTERSVSLAPYAGQVIYIAFRNQPIDWSIGWHSYLYVDDVEVRSACPPILALEGLYAVQSHESNAYTATLAEGNTASLVYTWHSTLLDSTWTDTMHTSLSYAELTYTTAGTDTLSVVAANACGADTATMTVTATYCPPISGNWSEDFDAVPFSTYNTTGVLPDCWHRQWGGYTMRAPHVVTLGNYPQGSLITYNSFALLMMAGTTAGYDTVSIVETPAFAGSLNGTALTLYHMQDNAGYGHLSLGYMQDSLFVPTDTLFNTSSGRTDTVLLSGFPPNVHRVALQWKCLSSWHGVIIDDIATLPPSNTPTAVITSPQRAAVGDTTAYVATLVTGSADSIAYTWHSSLLDTTWTDTNGSTLSAFILSYSAVGTDTVSVIATNAYGSDTASVAVGVYSRPLPHVTLVAPDTAMVFESYTLRATLNDCSRNGITSRWLSSLTGLDVTTAGAPDTMLIGYSVSGLDTVRLIVTNAYGADTAMSIVRAINCYARELPYNEDFEEIAPTSWDLPACWSDIWLGGSDYRPHISEDGFAGSEVFDKKLRLLAGWAVYLDTVVYVVLPGFEEEIGQLSLALSHYILQGSGTISVGYMHDSTYTRMQSLPQDNTAMRRDTVDFSTIGSTPANSRLAIGLHSSDLSTMAFIDNINVFVASQDTTVWHRVNVTASDPTMGTVSGGGWYVRGSLVTIDATPYPDYRFTSWNDGDTTNPRRVLVISDTSFTALFDSIPGDPTGISELRTPDSELQIYPNPAAGDVTVSVSQPSTVTVFDLTGRVVIPPTPIKSELLLPTSDLPSGTYFVRVVSDEKNATRKLVLK